MADELERLTRLNQDLEAKARGFHEQLRAFRERDKALNDALVSAQQLRAEMREQAEREAQLILREARADGERQVEAAKVEIRRLEGELDSLEKARLTYLSQLRALVERHLAELNATESPKAPARTSGESEAVEPRAHVKTRRRGWNRSSRNDGSATRRSSSGAGAGPSSTTPIRARRRACAAAGGA